MNKECRTCKHYRSGRCTHDNIGINEQQIRDIIVDHVIHAFDGDIQCNLQEVVEDLDLTDEQKIDLIGSICTVAENYLTDKSNMYLEEVGFKPDYDFHCKYYE